jgi:hypothetical protein
MPCAPACQQETGSVGEVPEMDTLVSIYVARPGASSNIATALVVRSPVEGYAPVGQFEQPH